MTVDRHPDLSAAGDRPARWRGPRRWLGLLVLAVACAGVAYLYFRQSLTEPFTADGASNVLQGQAMTHGNPLLRGWWTSDVSFYSTDLVEYAVVTAIRGLAPNVVHICGALTYTLTVLLAALVARGRERGAAGYCRAGIAVGIMLPLTLSYGIGIYLENPNHAGTAIPPLLLLVLVDRAGDRTSDRLGGRWLIPVAAGAVLVAGYVGDDLSLAIATVPLGVVCVIRLIAGRLIAGRGLGRGGRTARVPIDGALLDGALLAAAIASVVLGRLANWAIRALGGFDRSAVRGVASAPRSQWPANAHLLWQAVVIMFGANRPGMPTEQGTPNHPGLPYQPQLIRAQPLLSLMGDVHVVGLLLAVAGLAAGIAALCSRRGDRVTQVLAVAIAVLLAFGVFTTVLRSLSYIHEIAALMPLSAALAGRALPPLAGRLPARLRLARVAVPVLGAWLALSVAEFGYTATWPSLAPGQQAVAEWLVSQHERDGLSGYWQAASTTVTSGGRVLVAGITLPGARQLGQPTSKVPAAYRWESSVDWYQPASHDATFVIAVTSQASVLGGGLLVAQVRAAFGPPAAQHRIGAEVVMLYDYNLLSRLAPTTFP